MIVYVDLEHDRLRADGVAGRKSLADHRERGMVGRRLCNVEPEEQLQ